MSSQLDLSQPLEEQGPLDVIIHKLTDLILEADQNDTQSVLLVQRVQVREGGPELQQPTVYDSTTPLTDFTTTTRLVISGFAN